MRSSRGINALLLSRALTTGGYPSQATNVSQLQQQQFSVVSQLISQHVSQRMMWVGLGVAGLGALEIQRSYAQEAAVKQESAASEDAYAPPSELKGIPKDFTLYQYRICPFCNKVRAFLDYHNIPYKVVEVNPVTKAELKWSKYKKVPVLVMDDEQVNDSSAIISRLDAEIAATIPPPPPPPRTLPKLFTKPPQTLEVAAATPEEVRRWREWVDTRFVRIITANIYRTVGESWQTFSYITESGNFNWFQRTGARYFGTGLMYSVGRGMPKKYNIEGDLRQNLYSDADEFVKAIGERQFMGGKEPGLADLAVFGVIRAITGTDTFNDLMKNSNILPWYERMREKVGESSEVVEGWVQTTT
eukprot:TRINITY_DN4626_c0_g1_i4.p3 TRINITY_DN4626_c0_g1~~TRINITY_DN4626_c0_g1_i4.p3  ORF type:complete len:359 (-),score=74.18 TRINITY_DN4626_c0_g1_i4:123-1199(-)